MMAHLGKAIKAHLLRLVAFMKEHESWSTAVWKTKLQLSPLYAFPYSSVGEAKEIPHCAAASRELQS